MGQLPSLILAANPMQEGQLAREPHRTVAHMAYRVEPGPRLMRLSRTMPGQGGLLYCPVEAGRGTGRMDFLLRPTDPGVFCPAVPGGCGGSGGREHGPRPPVRPHPLPAGAGTLCAGALSIRLPPRPDPDLHRHFRRHPQGAAGRGPAAAGPGARGGRSGTGGGGLSAPGPNRFRHPPLPPGPAAAAGADTPQRLLVAGKLCARYFTYFQPGGTAHFVLFDDGETLRAKLRLAGEVGIRQCLAAWDDLRPAPAGQ